MADQHLEMKHYWVAFTGELRDGAGTNPVDEEVGELSVFLRELTRQLSESDFVHSPVVSHTGDGTVVLAAAVHAPTEGNAVDFARAAFTTAIEQCGGSSNFPDAEHRAWRVDKLLKSATVSALVPSAA